MPKVKSLGLSKKVCRDCCLLEAIDVYGKGCLFDDIWREGFVHCPGKGGEGWKDLTFKDARGICHKLFEHGVSVCITKKS
jgi:hypothetical protein